MPTVAEMLAEAMRRKNMSQQRLAKETGITAPWINTILRQNKAVGPEALLRMAEVLDIDKRELVRQAHYERAYDEWKPYLGHENGERAAPLTGMVPLIGRSSSGRKGAARPAYSAVAAPAAKAGSSPRIRGGMEAADAPGAYSGSAGAVGFDPECMAIRIEGDALEPVAYDGQYVVVSPRVPKEDVPDGAIVYVTYELPGDAGPRAMIRRMYRYRLASDETDTPGLPVYNFVPVNTRLRRSFVSPEGPLDTGLRHGRASLRAGDAGGALAPHEGAVTLRHRSVREMYPVVGVIFGSAR